MKFSYEDLISGDSIPVQGIGHIRSPLLKELKPTKGIGMWAYNLYLNILTWGKEELIKSIQAFTQRKLKALVENEKLSTFDVATLLEQSRELLRTAMAFFMDEELIWDKNKHEFLTRSKDDHRLIGSINRDNFDEVKDMMLQVNYINLGKSAKSTKYSSDKAKALWERVQNYLKTEVGKAVLDKRMQLGNIISKLSCVSVGYTLLNIYDLTVFQLYDQFFQYGYLRAMDLSDMVYSNHGGKDFDLQAWLKPITNFEKEQK